MLLTINYGFSRLGLLSKIQNNLMKSLVQKQYELKTTNNNNNNEIHNKLIRFYATTPPPKVTSTSQPIGKRRFRLPVETDAHKLVNYCCGANYFIDSEEIKLKEDSEYPDWIWELRLNYPPPLHELDPSTKEYYERLTVVGQQREWRLKNVWKKRFKIVNESLLKLEELRFRRRFRALAKFRYDAGYEIMEFHEREDYWNLDKKDLYRLPQEKEPFYPGIDSVNSSYALNNSFRFRKDLKKCGHFGC